MDASATSAARALWRARWWFRNLCSQSCGILPIRATRCAGRGAGVGWTCFRSCGVRVEITDADVPDAQEVDVKLLRLAQRMGGVVVTTDYNLNKVASLSGMRVLNVNELAGALRPAVLPGEELTVHVVREGKEPGQGVGYMDDGTMIVVENGRRHVGETQAVTVTTVLQTSAGRMIFARRKGERAG